MPTATSFTALGKGNGFPFCPGKVDVSGFDHWVTLAGYSKTNAAAGSSVTETQIKTSLERCMKLFWNLHSATASFTSTWAVDSLNFDKGLPNHEYIITPEPKGRICVGITQPTSSNTGMTEAQLNETGGVGCGTGGTFRINPKRMYNGSITDTSNFVGYGFSSLFDGTSSSGQQDGLNDIVASLKISSYLDGQSTSGTSEDPPGSGNFEFFDKTASILTKDNIPFRSFSSAIAFTVAAGSYSKTISSSSSSASASGSISGSVCAGSVTIPQNFFDFYTYS